MSQCNDAKTAAIADLLPTPEEIKRYRQCGYYISKKIFSPEELDAAIAASERYYEGLQGREIALPNGRTYSLAWHPGDGPDRLRKNDFSTLVVPELDALLRKPILGLIAALLCGEDVRLWHDQLLYKPPSNDTAPQSVGWHTDYGYWRTCSAEDMLTAWVPFTDMDESIGSITFVEGSLHWPENNHLNFFSPDLDGLEKQFNSGGAPVVKVPALLERGQVTFHHCKTIHGSGPNYTQQPRRSIALHLQPASNEYRAVYDGDQLVSHPNDALTRDEQDRPNYADATYCPLIGQIERARALQ